MEASHMPAGTAAGPPNSSKQPSPALLRLRPHIRRRVYIYIGLAQWGDYPYTFDLHGRKACFRQPPPPGSFSGLLLSCRVLHAEAASLLYSANRFILYYSQPESLAPLRALTVPSLASLTSLKIILNESSCHQPTDTSLEDCCLHGQASSSEPWPRGAYFCKRRHRDVHRPPLPGSLPSENDGRLEAAQAMLAEWHSTAAYMSSLVTPGKLELSLVCDIDPQHRQGYDLASRAVAPLSLLPPLKDCHVRLCKTPDHQLQQIARDAVMRPRGIATPYEKPSSLGTTLLTLPRELRLRILEYTDLIAPWREVTRSRHHRGYTVFHIRCRHQDGMDCPSEIHKGYQFNRCWLEIDIEPRIGCFCRRRHAAFSSRCRCWCPPGAALFLICRTLRQDAELVFFSGNRFIINDFDSDWPARLPSPELGQLGLGSTSTDYYPYKRFVASQFLREVIPTHCLAHLRFLELVFPPYPHDHWPRPQHPAMQDWCATVDWLRDKINGPGLTIWLLMANEDGRAPRPERKNMTGPQGDAILKAYMDIVSPLKRLATGDGGLARFHARLAYPWACTEDTYTRMLEPGGYKWYEASLQELNDRAERYVMGERYTSLYCNGAQVPAPSLWQDAFDTHI